MLGVLGFKMESKNYFFNKFLFGFNYLFYEWIWGDMNILIYFLFFNFSFGENT